MGGWWWSTGCYAATWKPEHVSAAPADTTCKACLRSKVWREASVNTQR